VLLIKLESNKSLLSSIIDSAKNTAGIISDNPPPYAQIKRFDKYAAVFELKGIYKASK
jgi:hypothetical protein